MRCYLEASNCYGNEFAWMNEVVISGYVEISGLVIETLIPPWKFSQRMNDVILFFAV